MTDSGSDHRSRRPAQASHSLSVSHWLSLECYFDFSKWHALRACNRGQVGWRSRHHTAAPHSAALSLLSPSKLWVQCGSTSPDSDTVTVNFDPELQSLTHWQSQSDP
eukprot:1883391-Rhodomonas_salina.3